MFVERPERIAKQCCGGVWRQGVTGSRITAAGAGPPFVFQAEDGIRDLVRSRGLGDVYKRQGWLAAELTGATIDWINEQNAGSALHDMLYPDIDPSCATAFTTATQVRVFVDHLTLDLDGDGLETIGINPAAPILFDHDGDGDLTFSAPQTVYMRQLDLDASNNTASGTSYQTTFTENDAAVAVVHVDLGRDDGSGWPL